MRARLGLNTQICCVSQDMRTIPVKEQGALQGQATLQGGWNVRHHWSPSAQYAAKDGSTSWPTPLCAGHKNGVSRATIL